MASDAAAGDLAVRLSDDHDLVRVQPFLAGVPCSIHGLALQDATVALRPCETLMLLDPAAHTFQYARTATYWDPSLEHRIAIHETVRKVGDALRTMVDYRGVFTLDGVMTANGFRPTEVNPRFGAALPARLPTADGRMLPLFFTHLAAVVGELDDFDTDKLEALLIDRLDANRAGSGFIRSDRGPTGGEEVTVQLTGDWTQDRWSAVRLAGANDEPFATATWGTDPQGGLIFCSFTDGMRIGPPAALTLVEVRRFLNEHWDLGLAEFVTAC